MLVQDIVSYVCVRVDVHLDIRGQCNIARLTRMLNQCFWKMTRSISETQGSLACSVMRLVLVDIVMNEVDLKWWRANVTFGSATRGCVCLIRIPCLVVGYLSIFACTIDANIYDACSSHDLSGFAITSHINRLYLRNLAREYTCLAHLTCPRSNVLSMSMWYTTIVVIVD